MTREEPCQHLFSHIAAFPGAAGKCVHCDARPEEVIADLRAANERLVRAQADDMAEIVEAGRKKAAAETRANVAEEAATLAHGAVILLEQAQQAVIDALQNDVAAAEARAERYRGFIADRICPIHQETDIWCFDGECNEARAALAEPTEERDNKLAAAEARAERYRKVLTDIRTVSATTDPVYKWADAALAEPGSE